MDTKWTPKAEGAPRRATAAERLAAVKRKARAHIAMLRVKEVAAALGVSTATVYGLVERGELGHVRLFSNAIRVDKMDLAAFVERRRTS